MASASLAQQLELYQIENEGGLKPEIRTCWFDRKTIVLPGPGELSREIEELGKAVERTGP